jgi:hypothetical protein
LYSKETKQKTVTLATVTKSDETVLASGSTPFGIGKWHHLSLWFKGNNIVASIDHRQLASITNNRHTTGQIGFMVSPWNHAEFDNLAVVKTKAWPRFVPHSNMTATASSAQPDVYEHRIYTSDQAIDGRIESRWASQFNPSLPLPQTITLDLSQPYKSFGLTYQPPIVMGRGGIITKYVVLISVDGKSFREATRGNWSADAATKIATWPEAFQARFVRLQATEVVGSGAAASEINVSLTPLK